MTNGLFNTPARRKLGIAVAAVAFATLVASAAYWGSRTFKIRSVLAANRIPYTVTFREAGYPANSDGSLSSTTPAFSTRSVRARSSDGSFVTAAFDGNDTEEQQPGPMVLRTVLSISHMQNATIYMRSGTKTTTPLRPEEAAAAKALPRDTTCLTHPERVGPWKVVGQGYFLGFDVVKHQFAPDQGTTVVEIWEAPKLDCEAIYHKVLFKRGPGGAIASITEKVALEIKLEEPSPSLFDLTGTEMNPSSGYRAEVSAAGMNPDVVVSPKLQEKLKRKDAAYQARWNQH